MLEKKNTITSLLEKSYLTRIYDISSSIELANNALVLCEENKFEDLKAKALSQLSLYYMIIGKYEESFNLAQKSIFLFEKSKNETGIAEVKYNLAGFYYKTNNYQMSVVNLVDALIIFKKTNDYHFISKCEKALGTVYEFINDEQNAIQCYKNAIKAAKKIADTNLETNAYNNLSGIYLKNGQLNAANEIIEKSIAIKHQNNDLRGLAFAIYGKGKVDFYQKKYDSAIENFKQSIAIHEKMGENLGLAMANYKLAKLYFDINNLEISKIYLDKSLNICNTFNISIVKIKSLFLMYNLFKQEKNESKSLEYLELYLKEKDSVLNAKDLKIIENYDLLLRMQTLQKETEQQQENTKAIAKKNKAEEATKVRKEFLSTMSHEIRTPLNAVLTIASILGENANEENKTLINSLKFSSNHLLKIVNDILDFTKLDSGKLDLDFQTTNLKNYITNFWNSYTIQTNDKKLNFNLIIDPDLNDNYFIDQTKITQILGNLINNAIKFTERGNVTLTLNVLDKQDEIDTVLFKISDTGIGIEKENLETIFETFSQLKNGITRKNDGTGLGLSISKKLIELHQSDIKVNSVFGKGSTFSFELKLKKAIEFKINKSANAEINLKGTSVLLVEDNAINAMVAKKLLSQWGIIIDHAVNGLIATEKSQTTKYDYILMDIHMPILDGYQAAKNIRTLVNLNKETPIIGLTADISAKDNTDYNFYFNDFLLKPLEIEKLKAVLSSTIE
ncbi:ATP-binding protein [Flavobacterium sp.]|uniref:tetratricopeptide repeat-containing hybrid sensor histidine kinase/response regulator n=1 Tax=Flavobacterium sp. TaxID=239 RepID=UPI003918A871